MSRRINGGLSDTSMIMAGAAFAMFLSAAVDVPSPWVLALVFYGYAIAAEMARQVRVSRRLTASARKQGE